MRAPSEQRTYTVSEITRLIKTSLEEEFPAVAVQGEVSNCRPSSAGHLYFSLKDRDALLSAVMFRSRYSSLTFRVADGMLVKAWGEVSVYEKRGTYQLLCDRLAPAGEEPAKAAEQGTNEVSLSVLAMTLTVISVFLPIVFVSSSSSIAATALMRPDGFW